MTNPVETFFIISPLGAERLLAHQLPASGTTRLYAGGVEWVGPVAEGLAINITSSIAQRVLLRVAEFKARDFPTLYKRLQKLAWRDLVEGGAVQFHVSSHQSRLKIKSRIEETALAAYQAFHRGHEPKASASDHSLDVYLRALEDRVVVSVDTSGELLHKRGYKSWSSVAPLRETLAASLVEALLGELGPRALKVPWLDPMAGSGTLLLEAAARGRAPTKRSWPFLHFPRFRGIQSELERAVATQRSTPLTGPFLLADKEPKCVAAIRKNFGNLLELTRNGNHPLQVEDFEVRCADLFGEGPPQVTTPGGVILLNPPYDERLAVAGGLPEFVRKTLEVLVKREKPLALGILVPRGLGMPRLGSEWKRKEVLHLNNGGLPVTFWIYRASSHAAS